MQAKPLRRPVPMLARIPVRSLTVCARASAALVLGFVPMVALLACLPMTALAADDVAITPFSTAAPGEPPAAWKFATLPRKTPTKYSIVDLGGVRALKVESDESYGNLVHSLKAQVSEKATLSWNWRVDKLVEDADLRVKSGEDSAAKVCVFFAFDASKLSLGERTRLSIASSTVGQDVPTESLCYVWDNKLPAETGVVSPFTKRVRFLVVQTGSGKLAQWVREKRNLAADYQKMFGDESEGKIPEVTGVSVSADSDNTHGHGLSYFGDVTLVP
jgi:hypothetical protein